MCGWIIISNWLPYLGHLYFSKGFDVIHMRNILLQGNVIAFYWDGLPSAELPGQTAWTFSDFPCFLIFHPTEYKLCKIEGKSNSFMTFMCNSMRTGEGANKPQETVSVLAKKS